MKTGAWLALVAGVLFAVCPLALPARTRPAAPPTPATTRKTVDAAKYLQQLSRQLKDKNPAPAYEQLSAFAMQKTSGVFGMRAALALGFFDYSKAHCAQAAKWFDRAKGDPLLRDYSLYWTAENDLAQGHSADA